MPRNAGEGQGFAGLHRTVRKGEVKEKGDSCASS